MNNMHARPLYNLTQSLDYLAAEFSHLDFTFHHYRENGHDYLKNLWPGGDREDVMVCVYRGDSIHEPFHRHDFIYFNYAYQNDYAALSDQEGNLIIIHQGECYIGQPFSGYALRSIPGVESTIIGVLIRKEAFFRNFLQTFASDNTLFHFFLDPEKDKFSDKYLHFSFRNVPEIRPLLELMVTEYANYGAPPLMSKPPGTVKTTGSVNPSAQGAPGTNTIRATAPGTNAFGKTQPAPGESREGSSLAAGAGNTRSQQVITSMAVTLYLLVARTYHTDANLVTNARTDEAADTPAGLMLAYMDDHFRTVSLKELSRQFSYHPNYISGLLHRETGKTFSEILLEKRMEHALVLLKGTNLSNEEIADTLGYTSTTNYYKAFRRYYGMPPREYMHKHQIRTNAAVNGYPLAGGNV